MPIIEANAVGRPVITSNLRPMTDVGGDAAIYVTPYDVEAIHNGILSLINTDVREPLLCAGLKNVKRFTPQYVLQRYLAVYSELQL
jgi:glycosyltransferase involved in cell wall biosynthesis